MVEEFDLLLEGCSFDSRPCHFHVTTVCKLLTHMCLCSPSSVNWYRPMAVMLCAWEGLSSHWPCIEGLVVWPPTGPVAWKKGDDHSALYTLSFRARQFTLPIISVGLCHCEAALYVCSGIKCCGKSHCHMALNAVELTAERNSTVMEHILHTHQ